ncbi:hypothetical protein VE01_00503 [Pseudogymnoascus verrucosus]|uniref:Uncharacterized protein n=1 Tax=Pseudogymnoascus verrucosus TaxID=342668 RepID=A0A2P2SWU3_9PEZI|nr:uncharacterized protein VE01_00503 [Pseudogymnoascus verrucosus]OBU01280.1 hypothetical protein VE01_00503 [Pseudogymnoascus verrucosus]
MMCSLPSLAPRDSHTLWYSSNHHTNDFPGQHDAITNVDHLSPNASSGQNAGPHPLRRGQQGLSSRTPLARLRADELYMERRKQNVQNYGSSWIKPPGVVKSLHQLREEKRELEEHQEALRREQLAQELAEAEAADELLQGEGGDGEMEEARDLDDDIPEADITGLGQGESGSEDDLDADESAGATMAQRIPDEMYRDALVRGNEGHSHGYGSEGGLASEDEDGSQMLQEDDLLHEQGLDDNADLDMDMDMDADLDSGVPESAMGGYEHTDTEEELTSSSDESEGEGGLPFGRRANEGLRESSGFQSSPRSSNLAPRTLGSDRRNSSFREVDDDGSHHSSQSIN